MKSLAEFDVDVLRCLSRRATSVSCSAIVYYMKTDTVLPRRILAKDVNNSLSKLARRGFASWALATSGTAEWSITKSGIDFLKEEK